MLTILRLIRVQQWYKNLLIFLPIIFSLQLSNLDMLYTTALGFFALSFMSSVNYIINDLVDMKSDKLHPEKKNRPIASGKVSRWHAIVLALALGGSSIYIALGLHKLFLVCVILLFILTQMYSFFLKTEAFADVLTIAINFVLRAISGTFIIDTYISAWLILCPFFLALFLAISKRAADTLYLGPHAYKFKRVLKYYTKDLSMSLMGIATTLLIVSYTLYAISNQARLLVTLPFAFYVIMRYFYLVKTGSEIGRHPHLVVKDLKMMIGILLWVFAVIAALYWNVFSVLSL